MTPAAQGTVAAQAGMAGGRGTLAGMTGVPQLLHGAKLTAQSPLIRSIPGVTRLGAQIPAATARHLPAIPSLIGAELLDQLAAGGTNRAINYLRPSQSQSPSRFSDAEGFAAYANMPRKSRPLIGAPELGVPVAELKLPGADIWANRHANPDIPSDPEGAFGKALEHFGVNAERPFEPYDHYFQNETMRERSLLGQVLPGGEHLKKLYPDQSPPIISFDDPNAAADFAIALDGISEHRASALISQRFDIPQDRAQLIWDKLPQAAREQAIAAQRTGIINQIQEQELLHPQQIQALVDVYKPQNELGVPEVHQAPVVSQPPPLLARPSEPEAPRPFNDPNSPSYIPSGPGTAADPATQKWNSLEPYTGPDIYGN